MKIEEITEVLSQNPEMLEELSQHEEIGELLTGYASEAVSKHNAKLRKSNANWAATAKDLKAQMESQSPIEMPEVETPATKALAPADASKDARISELEAQLQNFMKEQQVNKINNSVNDALSGVKFREGGLSIARQIISPDQFVIAEDGVVRHQDSMKSVSEYVSEDWVKGSQGSVLIETSQASGGGIHASQGAGTAATSKKFGDMTATEKGMYAKEHGIDAYNQLAAKG